MKKIFLFPCVGIFAVSTLSAADQNAAKPSEPQATPVKASTLPGADDATTSPVAKTPDKQATQTTNTQPMDGAKFAREAAVSGMAEIEAGKLAVAKGTDPKVREFGQMMVTQHTELGDKLKAVAASEKIELPTSAKHDKLMAKLSDKEGAAFDKAYVNAMVEDHETAVALFKNAAANCTNPSLKKFAAANLSTLETHLQHAQALQKGM